MFLSRVLFLWGTFETVLYDVLFYFNDDTAFDDDDYNDGYC